MVKLDNLFGEITGMVKTTEIDYIMVAGKKIDKKWFIEQAKRIDYNGSYGGAVIRDSLMIVMKDK